MVRVRACEWGGIKGECCGREKGVWGGGGGYICVVDVEWIGLMGLGVFRGAEEGCYDELTG